MRILILGATGMFGHVLFNFLSEHVGERLDVYGTVRSTEFKKFFAGKLHSKLIECKDVLNNEIINDMFNSLRPNIVVNCVSINYRTSSPADIVEMFSLLPHKMAFVCKEYGARFVQISSDGVFSGNSNVPYVEGDVPDANDVYGKAKYLGEVCSDNVINIRTSIIGHEIYGANGLLEWFLSSNVRCNCFADIYFNGITTLELSKILLDCIFPYSEIKGVYHVGSWPISRCQLFREIASTYGKEIMIHQVHQDRKVTRILDYTKFSNETGYQSKDWNVLIGEMFEYNRKKNNMMSHVNAHFVMMKI